MAPSIVHLPNGYTLTVTPVFGGLFFKANELSTYQNAFPPGWTIVLNCEDDDQEEPPSSVVDPDPTPRPDSPMRRKQHIHRFRRPSLHNDHLFISSISNPASNDFRAPASPTRQIAMMLWASLYWYFHQPAPSPYLSGPDLEQIPEAARPKGEWRVNINREGIFKAKYLLPKLERMGLISSEDSAVGLDPDDGLGRIAESWCRMFTSRRSFWQLDPRIFLFTLSPLQSNSPYPSASPASSRPSSPSRHPSVGIAVPRSDESSPHPIQTSIPPGPFSSGSHLPTFYPPPPPQYTFTNNVRHPIRPKPPRQGETFYTRYIPSLEQTLSFRVASLGKRQPHTPWRMSANFSSDGPSLATREFRPSVGSAMSSDPTIWVQNSFGHAPSLDLSAVDQMMVSDCELLHRWMNDERVARAWGVQGPIAQQEEFLRSALSSRHSFPVIGCFDGRPFGFFEIYWVREDRLAARMGTEAGVCGDWDRGLHVLVGEQDFRGPHRVRVWLSALVHYCWLADLRTNIVMMEPRVDNEKMRKYCQDVGFYQEREITFPQKQSSLMKIKRDTWEAPAI